MITTETEASAETITLPADPDALARVIIEHHDPEYAHEVFAALKRELAPSAMDTLASLASGSTPPPMPDPNAEPECGWNDDAGKGLSDLQQHIMEHLWSVTQLREYRYPPKHPADVPVRAPWHPDRVYRTDTASERAVTSRALRRLYDRGLVVLWGNVGGVRFRTDTISLTAEGRRHARRTMNTCVIQPREPGHRLANK
jgi:hypothetical protein